MNNSHKAFELPASAAHPTIGTRLYQAGEAALASFAGPAAGVIGCAAMYGSALLVANLTGNHGGQSLQAMQGFLAAGAGAVLALGCVANTVVGAVSGFMGENIEKIAPLRNTLKEAAIIAASGAGVAVVTGAAIMSLHGLSQVFQSSNSLWVLGPAVAATIVSAAVAVSGSLAGPLSLSMAGLDAASKAVYGKSVDGTPVINIADRLKKSREAQANANASITPVTPRMG